MAEAWVLAVIAAEGVERIVVGLPLIMDDSVGPAATQAVAWGNDVARRAGKPVVYVDERLSSFDAEQTLNDRKRGGEKLTRKRRKEQLDALAAAGFLQAFLDGKLRALNV
jgi:putative Holliday junction resolvase